MDKTVQWYPGHMVRAMRRIREYLEFIDLVIEVADARVAVSGRNPELGAICGSRARVLVLSREDLADPQATQGWIERSAREGVEAFAVDARSRGSVNELAKAIDAVAKRRKGSRRALVAGLPNSGKSTVINALLRRSAAKTEDRAGVTRQLQWFRLSPAVELMDSPGVLVPKIATKDAQWQLAICGAVPRDRYDAEAVVAEFHQWLVRNRPRTRVPDLAAFAEQRGFKRRGGEIDEHNAALAYVRVFNEGGFGRISFETPATEAPA